MTISTSILNNRTIDEHKDFEQNININSGDNSYEKSEDISSMMTNLNVRENTILPGLGSSSLSNNKNSLFPQDNYK